MDTATPADGFAKAYLLPNSSEETVRLEKQHDFYKSQTGGQLLAPEALQHVPAAGARILDAGCANGHWLRDLARQLPPDGTRALFGVDTAEHLFLPAESAGAELRRHDVTLPFPPAWAGTFDLVHQRLLCAGLRADAWPAVIANHRAALRPGGVLHLTEVEWILPDELPDAVPEQQKAQRMLRWVYAGSEKDWDVAYRLEDLLRAGGFEGVRKARHELGYGAAARDPAWRAASAAVTTDVYRGLGASLGYKVPGVADDEAGFRQWADRLEDEIRTCGHTVAMNFVYGRKPDA